MAPRLHVLGVHRLVPTPELFAEQWPRFGDDEQTRLHFSSVVLIECVAEVAGGFDIGKIKQVIPGQGPDAAQVPWDEGLLSMDGETLLERRMNCVRGEGSLRFGFFIHFWDPRFHLRGPMET